SVSFARPWSEYETGFGDGTDFWIGLRSIHELTGSAPKLLRVEAVTWSNVLYVAEYSGFIVGDASTKYTMTFGSYLTGSSNMTRDSLSYHRGMQFSTMDRDNEIHSSGSCSATYGNGGWWYRSCYHSNPNGIYRNSGSYDTNSVVWTGATNGYVTALKSIRLLLKAAASMTSSSRRSVVDCITKCAAVSTCECAATAFLSETKLCLMSAVWGADFSAAAPGKPVYRRQLLRSQPAVQVEDKTFTVIQQRLVGRLSFARCWTEYETGFGDGTDFWLGLRTINQLTGSAPKLLRVEAVTWSNILYVAEYSGFTVGDASTKYTMTFGSYLSDSSNMTSDSLSYHKGMQFSTMDRDNEIHSSGSCSATYGNGGWWYRKCYQFESEWDLSELRFSTGYRAFPGSSERDCVMKCDALGRKRCSAAVFLPETGRCLTSILRNASFGAAGGSGQVFRRRVDSLEPYMVDERMFFAILKREKGSLSFAQPWSAYENGFEDDTDFWIGLFIINELTGRTPRVLRVEAVTWADDLFIAEYSGFSVGDASTNYAMTFGSYLSDSSNMTGDALAFQNNSQFSTMDRDNDGRSGTSCSVAFCGNGGWWYSSCAFCNPSGVYATSAVADSLRKMMWRYATEGRYEALKSIQLILEL
uniref:Fibrinogen C-terminal domain-containing protein n=1 Tax=Macrostomum lignano TaxID=282301 RepID=A0A1I8JAL4_9PLAT